MPSGASTGVHEAVELRDGDPKRYGGKGVRRALANVVGVIGPELVGLDVLDQEALDARLIALDGTPNKARLGANAILAVSLACSHAAAAAERRAALPPSRRRPTREVLPVPLLNVLNGGAHAQTRVDFQEFMLAPIGLPTLRRGAARRRASASTRCASILHARGLGTGQGDEGGYAPDLRAQRGGGRAAARGDRRGRVHARPRRRASRWTRRRRSSTRTAATCSRARAAPSSRRSWSTSGLHGCDKYPIVSIEDGMAEDDWEGWRLLTDRLGARVQLVGDDLFVTNTRAASARDSIAASPTRS